MALFNLAFPLLGELPKYSELDLTSRDPRHVLSYGFELAPEPNMSWILPSDATPDCAQACPLTLAT
jgi:hypothetical protein